LKVDIIELLIVVGIVAAIAVPGLLRARMSGNEASAIGSMRAIKSSQSTYAASCGSGFYAPTVGGGDGFVGTDLNTDPFVKSSYTIAMTAGAAGAGAPASCNGVAAGATVSIYFIGAALTSGGGVRFFGTNQGGTIYHSTAAVAATQNGAPAGSNPLQ
jgi:type II secretory pathway pseudopilin PulG